MHDDHITLLIKAQGLTFVNISKIAVEISTDIFTHILHLSQCLDIDIDAGTLHVDLSDGEIARRLAELPPYQPKVTEGYLARYARNVEPAARGAILD